MAEAFHRAFDDYGASVGRIVALTSANDPRTARYVDLQRQPVDARHDSAVFEVAGQPLAFLVDGRDHSDDELVAKWIHRVSFRGDASWLGVLRPGRLDIYEVGLGAEELKPQPIESLPAGMLRLPALLYRPAPSRIGAVRRQLFHLLNESVQALRRFRIDNDNVISLVGRGLFWRFLIDRHLLDGVDPADICPGAADWDSCFDTKAGALRTFAWLDETFNGGLLPLTGAADLPAKAFTDVLATIARGATPSPQLRLPGMWQEVDFSHVPVGLLSELYESWAHQIDPAAALTESVHYTPRALVELIVAQTLETLEGVPQPRILDPAAGAGVFLVAAFRALVEREWKVEGRRPTRATLRRILNKQLCGFDINASALRLAELALYLTAIELDPEEHPRPISLLKFAPLRERVLLIRPATEGGSLGAVELTHAGKFDAVVGNPPWTSSKTAVKSTWIDAARSVVRARLGSTAADQLDFPDKNPDLPFVYLAAQWAREGGSIVLCLHSRWLFAQSKHAIRARIDLLKAVHVTGILNGSALRETMVWPGVRAPWCVLFARNEKAPQGAAFHFVSPQVDTTRESAQETLRIDWQDASVVAVDVLERKPWLLKSRFRGTPIDESAVEHVLREGEPLGVYLSELGVALRNGYLIGRAAGNQVPATAIQGYPDLRETQHNNFVVDTERLPPLSISKLLRPRDPKIYEPPLLLIREAIAANALAPRAVIAQTRLVYSESFHGMSFAGVEDGDALARYLQLVLQTSYATWFALMTAPAFGIERETIARDELLKLPVKRWSDLSGAQQRTAERLWKRMVNGLDEALHKEIDDFVFGLLGLFQSQRQAIRDTLETARTTGLAKKAATRPTTNAERDRFVLHCRRVLNGVLSASQRALEVALRPDLDRAGWRFIEIGKPTHARRTLSTKEWLEVAGQSGASMITVSLGASSKLVAMTDQYRYWTPTRAELLAMSLLSGREAA